jgi:hypothetical protein
MRVEGQEPHAMLHGDSGDPDIVPREWDGPSGVADLGIAQCRFGCNVATLNRALIEESAEQLLVFQPSSPGLEAAMELTQYNDRYGGAAEYGQNARIAAVKSGIGCGIEREIQDNGPSPPDPLCAFRAKLSRKALEEFCFVIEYNLK